jgi:dTDP-4-dehydrorhamnose reductase
MNILILGHKGMLGHMLVKYLTDQNYTIHTVSFRFPSKEFKDEILNFKGDYIINAIGAIPQKTNLFDINHELPIWLDKYANTKTIHAGTDCEIDNDEYGISKRIASDYIKKFSTNTKIIKSSIVGPELDSKSSLLEWFLNSIGEVKGFKNAMWNGITTLQWAMICDKIMSGWDSYPIENIVYSDCISKFDLLNQIKLVFQKDIIILEDNRYGINKCLKGNIKTENIKSQLLYLKKYYYNEVQKRSY